MSTEIFHVNVVSLERDMDLDDPEVVVPVGLSQLGVYLEGLYGEDIPAEPLVWRLAQQTLTSLALLSTNPYLDAPTQQAENYVPYWLKFFTPVVDTTTTLGKTVNRLLTDYEDSSEDEPDPDLSYSLGLFDLSSFIVAQQLEIPHPRYGNANLAKRVEAVTPKERALYVPPEQGKKTYLERVIELPTVKADHRKKVLRLRQLGVTIVDDTEEYVGRLRDRLAQ